MSFDVEAWSRCVARRTIIDAITVFLARMHELGNPLTEVRPRNLLRKERVWFVRPVYEPGTEGSDVGFFLRPDGYVDLLGKESNGWTPYQSAAFFNMTSDEAAALEAAPEPRDVMDLRFLTVANIEADGLVRGLAALLRHAEEPNS